MNNKKPTTTPQKNLPKTQVKQQPRVPKIWKAEDYVTNAISLQQVHSVKEAFDIFDVDKTGLIDAVELRNAFTSLGFASQNKFVLRILNDYDNDHNQGIDFAEFLKLSTSRLGQSGSKAQVQRVFNSFDLNKTGKISAADMKKVAEQLNQNLTEQQIEKMIFKADSDEDGFLTVDDFYVVLSSMNNQYAENQNY